MKLDLTKRLRAMMRTNAEARWKGHLSYDTPRRGEILEPTIRWQVKRAREVGFWCYRACSGVIL